MRRFTALLADPEEKEKRGLIQRAKTQGVLKCSGIRIEAGGVSQAWKILGPDKEVLKVVGKHKKLSGGVTDHEKFLVKALKEEPGLYDEIKAAVEAREVVIT